MCTGYGAPVDREVICAWWSLRSLLGVRWLLDHGVDPTAPGLEADLLRTRASSVRDRPSSPPTAAPGEQSDTPPAPVDLPAGFLFGGRHP